MVTSVFSLVQWTAGPLNVVWMEMDSLWTEHSLPVECLPWFFRFCSAPSKSGTTLTWCQWLDYRFRCVCMQTVLWGLVPLWMAASASCVFFLVGWMDGKKREWGDSRRDGLTTHSLSLSIHLSLSHFESQHLISSHMLSHWVRNQSFSLLLSLPIYLCHCLCHFILAIFYQSNMLAVGTNEPVSLQSRSNHTTSSLGLY